MSDENQKRRLFAALGSKAYDRALAIANAVVCAPMRLLNLIKKGQAKVVSRLQKAGSAVLAGHQRFATLIASVRRGFVSRSLYRQRGAIDRIGGLLCCAH